MRRQYNRPLAAVLLGIVLAAFLVSARSQLLSRLVSGRKAASEHDAA
jgi:hypothetical protein